LTKVKALTIIRIIALWVVGTIALGSLLLLALPSEIKVQHKLMCKQDADFLRREFVYLENWKQWRSEWSELDSSQWKTDGTDGLAGFVVQNGAFHWRLLSVSNESVIQYRRRHPVITGHVIKGQIVLKQDGDSTQLVWNETVKLEWQQRWKAFVIQELLDNQIKTDASDVLTFTQNSVADCPGYAVMENHHSKNYVVLRQADWANTTITNISTTCQLKLKDWCLRNDYEPLDRIQWLLWPYTNLQSDSMVAMVMILEDDTMRPQENADTLAMSDDFLVMYFNDEAYVYSKQLGADMYLSTPGLIAKLKDEGKRISFPLIVEALEEKKEVNSANEWLWLYRIKLTEQMSVPE